MSVWKNPPSSGVGGDVDLNAHSVTELNDVMSAGSGAIISSQERADVNEAKAHLQKKYYLWLRMLFQGASDTFNWCDMYDMDGTRGDWFYDAANGNAAFNVDRDNNGQWSEGMLYCRAQRFNEFKAEARFKVYDADLAMEFGFILIDFDYTGAGHAFIVAPGSSGNIRFERWDNWYANAVLQTANFPISVDTWYTATVERLSDNTFNFWLNDTLIFSSVNDAAEPTWKTSDVGVQFATGGTGVGVIDVSPAGRLEYLEIYMPQNGRA